ncbi:acyl carrier protein [Micromonospora sp. 4G57]|uniref:Acyl carrier protein n=1 Tax=Micromonospora sicca TaxID=2202420 RepID=A0ABU5J6N3_9ACTN|nr:MULTISPECIES: acyl carrier protein [unclassified Micromonospora]MDZ5443043.1 acyl carrier protein [Micromonospora sp. 4G57]MDZ5488245.1 acyl carrier protein [Micromonospora sp. 4G53]
MTLSEVVAGVLEVDPAEVTDESGPQTIGTWTSLRHLQLVVTLEEVYGLSFAFEEIRDVRSVGELRTVLRAKGTEAR